MRRTILFFSANPLGTQKVRLDEEISAIERSLERSKRRGEFEIVQKWAINNDDLRRGLLGHQPQIVHFSGHGAQKGLLVFEDDNGGEGPISNRDLKSLFGPCAEYVQCVLLNACYSKQQASAIATHIDYVVGVNPSLGDEAAIRYSVAFYDALGAGMGYDVAHDFGRNAIALTSIPEGLTPVLLAGPRCNNLEGVLETPMPSPAPVDELISILEFRIEKILSHMEETREDRIEMILDIRARFGSRAQRETSAGGFARRLQSIQKLFSELHERNKKALQAGQFVLSRELTTNIHELLWELNDSTHTFWKISHSSVRFCGFKVFVPADFAADYPGWLPPRVLPLLSGEWVKDWDANSDVRRPVRESLLSAVCAFERQLVDSEMISGQ